MCSGSNVSLQCNVARFSFFQRFFLAMQFPQKTTTDGTTKRKKEKKDRSFTKIVARGRRMNGGIVLGLRLFGCSRGEEVSPIRCTFAGQHPFNFPCSSRRCELAFSSRIL